MDKLIAFFKNVWFRRGVAVACLGYTFFMIWLAYISYGYYMDLENPTPLFVLYLFVNICAAALLVISRKQVITQINSYILPPIIFVILLCAFGNWYLIVPPLVVMLVLFFANSSNETLKTVLGTMYLLMFVIGIVGYIGIKIFIGDITFTTGVDLSKRDPNYEKLSSSGDYRIVRYFDTNGINTVQMYYVEETKDDIKIPLGMCKKVSGCEYIHTAAYSGIPRDVVEWSKTGSGSEQREVILVESVVRENPYLIDRTESKSFIQQIFDILFGSDDDEEKSSSSSSSKSSDSSAGSSGSGESDDPQDDSSSGEDSSSGDSSQS